jgi:RecB family endonuclease NucS
MVIPIPISITSASDIVVEQEMELVTFQDIQVNEAKVEEFVRKHVGLIFDDDEEETLLIVGQQVINLKHARNDLVALDAEGNLVLIEIKRDASDMNRAEAFGVSGHPVRCKPCYDSDGR